MQDAKQGELSKPMLLNREQCLKYKKRLSDFYYSNITGALKFDNLE